MLSQQAMSSQLKYPIGRFFTTDSIQAFFATIDRQTADKTNWIMCLHNYLQNQTAWSEADKAAILHIDYKKYAKLYFELNPWSSNKRRKQENKKKS